MGHTQIIHDSKHILLHLLAFSLHAYHWKSVHQLKLHTGHVIQSFCNFLIISGTLEASVTLLPNVRVLWQTWCFHAHLVPSCTLKGIQLNTYLRKSMWGILYVLFWPIYFYLHQNHAFAFWSLDVTSSSVLRKQCSHFLALRNSFEYIQILDLLGFVITANPSIHLIGVFTPSVVADMARSRSNFSFTSSSKDLGCYELAHWQLYQGKSLLSALNQVV